MEIEAVKREVATILREELGGSPYRAFFFGSRVSGTAGSRSDLDVGIEGETVVSTEKMRNIRARLEALPTLYSIDIVDFSTISEEFKQVAKEYTEKII